MVFYNLDYVAIGILTLVLIGQILVRRKVWFFKSADDVVLSHRFSKMLKWFWAVSVLAILGNQTVLSFTQYEFWQNDPLAKHYLPPYQSIDYFLGYVGVRYFGPWILAFLASVLFSWVAGYLNKKFGERFFEKEEIQLIALGTFLTGWPGFLFYLSLLLFGYLALQIVNNSRVAFSNRPLKNILKESRTSADLTLTSTDDMQTGLENNANRSGKDFLESASSRRISAYYLWMPFAISAIIIKIEFLEFFGLTWFWGQFSLGDFYKLFTNY